jgi:hypothetical protein
MPIIVPRAFEPPVAARHRFDDRGSVCRECLGVVPVPERTKRCRSVTVPGSLDVARQSAG